MDVLTALNYADVGRPPKPALSEAEGAAPSSEARG